MYRIHDDPPGISGWLIEGRTIYDAFVLNEKRNALYYHGGQSVFQVLSAMTAATDIGKSTVIVNGVLGAPTNKWYFASAANAAGLPTITHGTAITTSAWTAMVDTSSNVVNHYEFTPTSGHTVVRVIETDASNYPLAFADVIINIGA